MKSLKFERFYIEFDTPLLVVAALAAAALVLVLGWLLGKRLIKWMSLFL